MLEYQGLMSALQSRAGLQDTERARAGAESALEVIAGWLDPTDRQRLADALPSRVGSLVLRSARQVDDAPQLLREVAAAVQEPPERALYLVQALLSALADEEPEVAGLVRQRVPADVADLFTAPGGGPPPERAASAATDLATELTEAEVATALQRLPGWTGDTHRLSRTVVLPEGLGQRALDRIAAAQQEMNHHARRTDGPDGVTFDVWTHSRGVVTELDVRLAARISEIVENP
jgi:pterin-4a-carbinolamine dehydratase/uncharacterized protein (DUF2267 family)